MVEKDVFDSSVLELTTYEECNESCFLPKEPDIIHHLLPCELDISPIFEDAMVDLTTTIEISIDHNIHVNNKPHAKQMT